MSDYFTNVNRNSVGQQPLNVGQSQKVVGPNKGGGKAPGSEIGKSNAKSMKTAQQIWANSVNEFVEANKDIAGSDKAAGAFMERGNDDGSRRSSISSQVSMQSDSSQFSGLPEAKEDILGPNELVKVDKPLDEPKQFLPGQGKIDENVNLDRTNQKFEDNFSKLEQILANENKDAPSKPINPKQSKLDDMIAELEQMAKDHQPLPEKSKKEVFDESLAKRTSITPSMLKNARKNKLKELPVYLCARPLETSPPGFKGKGLHGFVAIGQPGKANVKGAKVFSYGSDDMTTSLKLDSKKVDKLAKDITRVPYTDNKNKTHYDEHPTFTDDAIASFRRMAQKGAKFHNMADFHRQYYAERMAHEERNHPDLVARKEGADQRKEEMERLTKAYKTLPKNTDRQTKNAARKAMRDAQGAYRRPIRKANAMRVVLHGQIAKDAIAVFKAFKKTDGSVSGALSNSVLRGWQPAGADDPGNKNLANTDANIFEKPGAENQPGVEFRQQHGVKATDVIEAQRRQWMADNYLDDKAGGLAGNGLAPELCNKIEPFNLTQTVEEVEAELDTAIAKSNQNLKMGKYAPITEGDKEAVAFGLDSKAIRDKRRYSPLLVVKNERKGGLFRLLTYLKRKFRSKKSQLRNEGNCNAAAGSLIRLAAQQGAKRHNPVGGDRQHGISQDVLWNPTPNLKPKPQEKTEFVGTGKQMPGVAPPKADQDQIDIEQKEQMDELGLENVDQLREHENIAAFKPDSRRLMDVTKREVEELRQGARSLNMALHDLDLTSELMDKYAPKPSMFHRRERFQDVRDGMNDLKTALYSGENAAIRKYAGKAAEAAGAFHETRMDEHFKKNGQEFDSSTRNTNELEALVSIDGAPSGERKMLLANSLRTTANRIVEERQKLIDNLEHTLAKPAISKIEEQKLLIGAELLSRIDGSDDALEDLTERAIEKVKQSRAADPKDDPESNRRGTVV